MCRFLVFSFQSRDGFTLTASLVWSGTRSAERARRIVIIPDKHKFWIHKLKITLGFTSSHDIREFPALSRACEPVREKDQNKRSMHLVLA